MANSSEVMSKKAKLETSNGNDTNELDADAYFAKFRPDRESRCTWTKDSCPKESPHIHNDNT